MGRAYELSRTNSITSLYASGRPKFLSSYTLIFPIYLCGCSQSFARDEIRASYRSGEFCSRFECLNLLPTNYASTDTNSSQ